MTETKRRIKELKALLPSVREKVISVALLLAMSLAMVASASYAWYTLSFAPEVSQITTTVSSNGSLEVALAGLYDEEGNLIQPLASGTGDSFSADGQTTVNANLTWGNLINLSNHYGIESLVLRPATLLDKSAAFLSSVDYGSDGRYEGSAIDFGLTSWKELDGKYSFAVTDTMRYGVRAVSSVTYPDGKGALQEKMDAAEEIFQEAYRQYNAIVNNSTYISTIESLVQVFINGSVNQYLNGSTDPIVCTDYVTPLCKMIEQLYNEPICGMGDALAAMANAQMSLVTNNYTPYNRDTLMAASATELEENNVSLLYLAEYKSLYNKVYTQMLAMQELETRSLYEDIYWEDSKDDEGNVKKGIVDVVDELISIDTVTVNGKTVRAILSQGKSALLSYASSLPDPTPITVFEGILWECEAYSGCRMAATIHYYIRAYGVKAVDKDAIIRTSLKSTDSAYYYLAKEDVEKKASNSGNAFKGTMVAGDTYGMVLDLWVRTNAANSYLTLDGLAEVEIYYEQSAIKVLDGNTMVSRDEWTYTYYTGETADMEGSTIKLQADMSVYQIPEDLDGDGEIAEYTVDANGKVFTNPQAGKTYYTIYEGYFYNSENDAKVFQIGEDGKATETYLTYTDVVPKLIEKKNVIGFNSSNRVDDAYQDLLSSGEMSATQGSGSCYIFYADTPEASASALELLSHLTLAFFDANGNKLSLAVLDVDNVFADGGKYVVPIKIKESNFTSEDGAYYITDLQQNEAMLLSVVVFLDGEGLENSMVMAKDSIQGKLNLQFASTANLESMFNTDLSLQSVTLSATIREKNFKYTGQPQTTTLTAMVEGLNAKTVQAIFQRKVNATQGSQMEPVDLTLQEGVGWVGTPSFTMPGTYVLKSLWVDGIEYALPEEIVVTVDGLNVTYCAVSGEGMVLTADNYVTRSVTVRIEADEATQPSKMSVRFLTDENKIVSGNLFYDSERGWWTGDVTFTSSGTYTLTYLVMDDTYFELDEGYQKVVDAYLGLRTSVRLRRDGGLTFPFEGKEQEIDVYAQIFTDTGDELKGLENVTLNYAMRGSAVLERGLEAELTWDGEYYSGKFNVKKIGVFNFAQITAGTNVITVAESAPTITSQAVDPPEYQGSSMEYNGENTSDFVIMNADVLPYYVVQLDNASGAERFEAIFVDPSNQEHTVIMNTADSQIYDDGTGDYKFVVPNTSSGSRNGAWLVKEVRVYGVYDRQGNYYGDTVEGQQAYAPYYSVTPNHSFTIIDKFSVSVDNALTLNNAFMEAVNLSDSNGNSLNVTIGLGGVELPDVLSISNPVLTLKYLGGSGTYGNYTFSGTTGHETITCELTYDEASGKWLVSTDEVAYLAGTYSYTLDFDITGENFVTKHYTYEGKQTVDGKTSDIVVLEVYSESPEVTISSVSTNQSSDRYYLTSTPNSLNVVTGSFNNKIDNYNAVVYMYVSAQSGTLDQEQVTIKYPTVTLSLSGVPTTHGGVTMVFPGGNNTSSTFTFAAGKTTASSTIGSGTDGVFNEGILGLGSGVTTWPVFYPAGMQTVQTITVTYGGVAYTVTVSNAVTINNPQYPPYVDFAVNDSTFTGTTPSRVFGVPQADGTFKITLPDSQTWTADGLSADDGDFVLQSDNTDQVWTGSYKLTSNGYTTYSRNIKVYTATSTTTTWTITKVITGWKVGNTVYQPGETVTITGSQTITAVISETNGPPTTQTETATRTVTTFTKTGTSYRQPSGTKVSSTTNTDVTTYG